jgi:hypothetical protein
MDVFINATDLLKNYDPSAIKEFTFVWTIDGVIFPEMDYHKSFDLLNASYSGFIGHPDVLATGMAVQSIN